jgi:hypothetical protein
MPAGLGGLMMKWLVALILLTSCGASTAVAPTPIVVTQVVERTVIAVQTAIVKETVVVTATPKPATPTRPVPTPTPAPATGRWEVSEDASSFDDSKRVILTLLAENEIQGPIGSYLPALLLRCQEGVTEAFIDLGMQADVEGISDTATVRMRFDAEEAFTAQASKSTDGEALFLPAPETFVDTLLNYDQLAFQFTPFSANPAEMTFDLRGLDEAIGPLREACP